jgi:hypothetical protein
MQLITRAQRRGSSTRSILGVATAVVIAGAALTMLGPAFGSGDDDFDQTKLLAAHRRACEELNGPEVKAAELESCIGLLLSFKAGPVEVFVSRKAGRT